MDLREVFAANLRRSRHERGSHKMILTTRRRSAAAISASSKRASITRSLKIIRKLSAVLNVEPAELLLLKLPNKATAWTAGAQYQIGHPRRPDDRRAPRGRRRIRGGSRGLRPSALSAPRGTARTEENRQIAMPEYAAKKATLIERWGC